MEFGLPWCCETTAVAGLRTDHGTWQRPPQDGPGQGWMGDGLLSLSLPLSPSLSFSLCCRPYAALYAQLGSLMSEEEASEAC